MGLPPTTNYLQPFSITSYHQSELLPVDKTLLMTVTYITLCLDEIAYSQLSGDFQKFDVKTISSSLLFIKPLQFSPTCTLVRRYTRISSIQLHSTDCLAFPDSHALPQVAVFWIRLYLINKAFYYSARLRVF